MDELVAIERAPTVTKPQEKQPPVVKMIGGIPFLQLDVDAYVRRTMSPDDPKSVDEEKERMFGDKGFYNKDETWRYNNGVYAARDKDGNIFVGSVPTDDVLKSKGVKAEDLHNAVRKELRDTFGGWENQTGGINVPFSQHDGWGNTPVRNFYNQWVQNASQENTVPALPDDLKEVFVSTPDK